ncbi:2-keto-4-pentenoate hydratase [Roseomonas sp. USHLN139]|uniref:2-keto-4-pentenoate hydratase n=1 Tax=Roseomonas sp. USHLN139 TaxID=3081298 RepID=UPI003B02C7BB
MRRILLAAVLSLGASHSVLAADPPTCPDAAAMQAMAASLLSNAPVQAFTGNFSLADGLCAQGKLVPAMSAKLGAVVGWKVGLTNEAAQKRFGTTHPLAAPIYEATVRARSGASLPAAFGAVPVVEADLIVRVRDAGINQAGDDHVALLRHIDQVIPFIELPDLALAEMRQMNGPNLLAVGVGARLGVVGEPITPEATPDFAARLGSMRVRLATEEKELATAPGTALLGHPLNVIPWLVKDLASRGLALKPGDMISLGGFSPAVPAEAGRTYTTTYTGLLEQPVSVSVTLQ